MHFLRILFLTKFCILANAAANKSNQGTNKNKKEKKNTLSVIDRLEMPSTPRLAMRSSSATPRKTRSNSLLDPKNVPKNKQLFTPQVKRR